MSIENYPSIDFIRQCFRYEDGKLFWLSRPRDHFVDDRAFRIWNTRFAGKEAANLCLGKDGRVRFQVRVCERAIYRHIVVWALHYGEWRTKLDHEDRNPANDRIGNLRIASPTQNNANGPRRKRNKSGFKGVHLCRATNRWRASIQVNRRTINLGRYDSPEDAHEAYMNAAVKYWGEFACDGHRQGDPE